MNKYIILALVGAMAVTANAATWQYKTTETEMGDKIFTASIESEKTKYGNFAEMEVSTGIGDEIELGFLFTERGIRTCISNCLLSFNIDGVRHSTIKFRQLSGMPFFIVRDKELTKLILGAKEVKFQASNLTFGFISDVYTFKQDDKFDENKYKALKSN